MTQKEKIKQLEMQLDIAKRHTYINNTHTLHCNNGELYVDYEEDKRLVWNTDDLFKDLASIIYMVTKENTKMQKMYLDLIKESLNEINN
jgi:hypothetical protein